VRFLADENFNNHILRALFRRDETIDIVRVQDVGLSAVDDPEILEWAAEENRVLLTHDVETMTQFAYERVREGKEMSGVTEVDQTASML
jgi:predicted nuclease of predicted toxin-antitoxin system